MADFGDCGDPSQGYRFIGGGTVENTRQHRDCRAHVRFTWEQLGAEPITYTKRVELRRGQTRRVKVAIPATQDQIDLHQSAQGDCSAKVKIVDMFGLPPYEWVGIPPPKACGQSRTRERQAGRTLARATPRRVKGRG